MVLVPLFSLLQMTVFKAQAPSRAVARSLASSHWRNYKSIPFISSRIVSHVSVKDYCISAFLPFELEFSCTLFKRSCATIVSLNYMNLRESKQNCFWGMILLSTVVLLPFSTFTTVILLHLESTGLSVESLLTWVMNPMSSQSFLMWTKLFYSVCAHVKDDVVAHM